MTVFSDIVRKNSVIRTAYFCYDKAPGFIKSYLLILYGLKCYLSAKWRGPAAPDIVFFASAPNERTAIAHVRRHLQGLRAGEISLSRSSCFRPGSLKALPAFLLLVPRLYRLAHRLGRRSHFLPACRIFSTVTYYLRYRQLLGASAARSVFIANHYAPESVALAAAAHSGGLKVISINHANGTWHRSDYVPPLHSDLVAVTSRAILDVYAGHSRGRLHSVFVPLATPQRPMRRCTASGMPVTVGIFLTALTNMERLHRLVGLLERNPGVGQILIRSHPVKVVNEDLSSLTEHGDRVAESGAIPLSENIDRCDIAICGSSSVTIDILHGGVPVLYDAELDDIAYDLNGFLNAKLIPLLPATLDAAALQSVDRFYANPVWPGVMRHFDASYLQDEAAMFRQLGDAVQRVVRASEPAEARDRPHEAPVDVPVPAAVP